jgi:hypothetical protein
MVVMVMVIRHHFSSLGFDSQSSKSAIINEALEACKVGTSHIAESLPHNVRPSLYTVYATLGQAVLGGLSLLQKAFFCKLIQDAGDAFLGLAREAIDDILSSQNWELKQ